MIVCCFELFLTDQTYRVLYFVFHLSISVAEQLYRMDASEGSILQKKYGFRTIPMLLMFFEGQLVEATNAHGSAPAIKVSLD